MQGLKASARCFASLNLQHLQIGRKTKVFANSFTYVSPSRYEKPHKCFIFSNLWDSSCDSNRIKIASLLHLQKPAIDAAKGYYNISYKAFANVIKSNRIAKKFHQKFHLKGKMPIFAVN